MDQTQFETQTQFEGKQEETVAVKVSETKAAPKKRIDVAYMTELALLAGIVVLMAFTPLGYLHVGLVQITFIVVPVAVGAVVLGPKAGLFLGLVFGLTSLLQPSSLAMISMVPWQSPIVCIIPRLFVGLVPALIYKGLSKVSKNRQINTAIACVLAPITNTILYLAFFVTFLGQFMAGYNPEAFGVFANQGFFKCFGIMLGMVSVNAIVEAASCLVIATAICNALWFTVNRNRR